MRVDILGRCPLALAAATAWLGAVAPALGGGSPALQEARRLLGAYDEDPAGVDKARELLEAAVARQADAETLVALARACYLWGDLRASSAEEKLASYHRGREAAQRAIELAPQDADTHFWYAVNTGRWAQSAGPLRSLTVLPTLRNEVETTLRLRPQHAPARRLAGNLSFQTPEFVGGSKARAEEQFRLGLEIDPRLTGIRVDLARLLIASERYAEARQELQRVLDEPAPSNRAEWNARDVPAARRLLAKIAGP